MDVGDDFGLFDYIICHGVYSWVPAEVREKILAISSRNLAPQGVAYVSYNCFPGWHLAGMIREMMLYHTQRFTEPAKRIQQARAFLDYLAMGTVDLKSSYARLLKEEADLLRGTSENYLFHDHLEVVNQPVYFHQFAERAAAHGLQYIWESYQGDRAGYLRNEVKETLDRLSTDLVRREQNIDFLINRRFRMSLLCHDDVTLDRTLPAEQLTAFRFIGAARPQSARWMSAPCARRHSAPGGESITVDNAVGKATLACLAETTPRALSFVELYDAVRARLDEAKDLQPVPDDTLRRAITGLLRQCVWPRLVALHIHRSSAQTVVSERPMASLVARYQAKSADRVTNLWHETVVVSPGERHILPLLDGQHNRAALLDILVGMAESEQIKIAVEGQPVRDKEKLALILGGQLDACLKMLARRGLLVQ